MCAKSLRARASFSAGGISSAVSSAPITASVEKGFMTSEPLSTREKPENSDSTATPAGSLPAARATTYSSGWALTASRTVE